MARIFSISLVAVALLTISGAAKAQAQYGLKIVAQTGKSIGNYGPVQDLGQEPSINNFGKVAFIARDQVGAQNGRVFVVDDPSVLKSFDLTAQQVTGELVQINDLDQVTYRSYLGRSGFFAIL
jgi:hypothetical protein